MSTKQMKLTRGKDAQYMRAWLSELAPEERSTAREVGDAMAERFPHVSFGTLKNRWQTLKHRGMVDSEQADGRHWEYWLTPEGEEFWKWMMNTEEGLAWGKSRAPRVSTGRGKEQARDKGELPTSMVPIVLDDEEANEFDLIWALVPAGVDIIWVEVLEDGSKKPHKIKRKSEEEPEDEVELLKARLRELGEDI